MNAPKGCLRLIPALAGAAALAIIPLLLILMACRADMPRAKDGQGVEFVCISKAIPGTPDKPGTADLWQKVGETGTNHPVYLRLLQTDPSQPSMFTRVSQP